MKYIDRNTSVSFTGYRVNKILLSTTDQQILYKIGDVVEAVIEQLYKRGYRTFLSGMAEGFDLIAARRVILLKSKYPDIQFVAVVPYRGQESDFSFLWKRYYAYCYDNADEIITLSPNYRRGCFFVRNDFLIENSYLVVCYYDSRPGGTHYTVTKAIKSNLEIINIHKML